MSTACPVCESGDSVRVLDIPGLPVFCNIQLDSRTEALSQPKGEMHLEYCSACSHFYNSAFDESLLAYSQDYENSLHYSATFNRYAEELAGRLVREYGLYGKKIIDIGCGKGDFLSLICELGANEGIGFDRSYEEGRSDQPSKGTVHFVKDFFSRKYAHLDPDFVSCRHVLEHIRGPRIFLQDILAAVGPESGCGFYFEVPNVIYTIRDMGVWDVIYEHCQYFSPCSLTRLFAQEGVQVRQVYDCFGGQFLAVEAGMPSAMEVSGSFGELPSQASIAGLAKQFDASFRSIVGKWRQKLSLIEGTAVVWGAGSKGTTFLNLLDSADRIECIIDINPNKQGKFTPCTGHEILAPESLEDIRPQHVFIMNPMYKDEIEAAMQASGVHAKTHVVT